MNKFFITLIFMAFSVCLLPGCTTQIHPSGQINQPPQIAFDKFNNVQLNKSALPAKYAGQPANDKAITKFDELLTKKIIGIYPELNKPGTSGRTLLIIPEVVDIKFVGGGARFWAGAMAGSSALLMKVKFIDQSTGNIIAFPEFYSKCSAVAGSVSVGGNDNAMLHRAASEVAQYISNYRGQINN